MGRKPQRPTPAYRRGYEDIEWRGTPPKEPPAQLAHDTPGSAYSMTSINEALKAVYSRPSFYSAYFTKTEDLKPEPQPTPEPMPSPTPKAKAKAETDAVVSPAVTLGDQLWATVSPAAIKDIQRLATEAAQNAVLDADRGPVKIEWTIDARPFAKVDGVVNKKVLDAVLKCLKAGLTNILLVGPAGAGKTKLAHQVAEAVGRPFAELSCTSGMPEWHLVGRATPNLTTGDQNYAPSAFVKAYEEGGVFLLDEIDAADPNVILVMNSALANGQMSLPARVANPIAKRHPDFVLIAAANTFGNGANRQYVGRNQLDASTLSRFACAVIEVDYDHKLEESLVADRTVLNKVWAIREKVTALGLRRVVGTRELLAVARLVHSGETMSMAIEALTTGWTPDEKTKVGAK